MAIWDTVKKVAIFVRCSSGWHGGKWEPIRGKPECHLGKKCPDCRQYVTTEKHKYGDWRYVDYSKCDSVRECIHCGSLDKTVIHKYESVDKDENCRIIEECSRCGDRRLGREDHSWIKKFDHDVKFDGKRKCKVCGKME